jgi:acetyl-CoA carboxylase alpha subunit
MSETNWFENEIKRHAQKINDLEQFADETSVNVVKLIEHQKTSRKSFEEINRIVTKLDRAEIRRDERYRLWKIFLGVFVMGIFIGAIINDVHLIKIIFGK